jgi:phosphatidylserine/phosphatidylglycerophosphate/cardiolipin synthase-like enzyme
MEALFTSLAGGGALRRRILDVIAEASALAVSNKIDIHVMAFAFTDETLAEALADAAARHPTMTIRILADWSQRIRGRGQQVGRLAALGLPNLRVRYRRDQPYLWDVTAAHMRWSYHTSRGLLHHKTLGVLVDGRPRQLICGSFNWTATAARSYENLLVVTADRPGTCELMARIELEFEALWSDGRASLSPHEAHLHYQAIRAEFHRDPAISPAAIVGLADGQGEPLQVLDAACHPPRQQTESSADGAPSRVADLPIAVAFSCSDPQQARRRGYAECNRAQRLLLHTPSGAAKSVPLTLTNLALDTIFRAAPGDTLKIAMYGLSARVPEYGALLDAARRGVRLFVLLDRGVGSDTSARFAAVQHSEGLPIAVRTAGKIMHQKYIVNTTTDIVFTGTANLSTDASLRHFEHRIRISGCPKLARQFGADFDEIWARLSPHQPAASQPSREDEGRSTWRQPAWRPLAKRPT